MREIKFRAWEERKKRMLYTDYNSPHNWYLGSRTCKCAYERRFKYENFYLSEPMQFTGLKDKNGKEIYEGDILLSDVEMFFITWNKENACFDYEKIQSKIYVRLPLDDYTLKEYEIIGNIYENPKLLEG